MIGKPAAATAPVLIITSFTNCRKAACNRPQWCCAGSQAATVEASRLKDALYCRQPCWRHTYRLQYSNCSTAPCCSAMLKDNTGLQAGRGSTPLWCRRGGLLRRSCVGAWQLPDGPSGSAPGSGWPSCGSAAAWLPVSCSAQLALILSEGP